MIEETISKIAPITLRMMPFEENYRRVQRRCPTGGPDRLQRFGICTKGPTKSRGNIIETAQVWHLNKTTTHDAGQTPISYGLRGQPHGVAVFHDVPFSAGSM